MTKGRNCLDSASQDVDDRMHNMELQMKHQLGELLRTYRKLEEETGENRMKGRKCAEHRKQIKNLQNEKRDLLIASKFLPVDGAANNSCSCNNKHGGGIANNNNPADIVSDLMEIYQYQIELVDDCWDALKEIGVSVDYLVKLMRKYQLNIQKHYGGLKTAEQYYKRQEILENRLEIITTKFNVLMKNIEGIRSFIMERLYHRQQFFDKVQGYKMQIEKLKNLLNSYVAQANQAYDKYDESKMQDKMIRKRNTTECQIFVSDLKESIRFLRNDRSIRTFLHIKGRERPFLESRSDRTWRKMHDVLTSTKKLIPAYRRAFRLISDQSGFSSVEEILQYYTQTEANNFTNFQYLIDLNAMIKSLEPEIMGSRDQIIEQKQTHLRTHYGHVKTLKSLKKNKSSLVVDLQNCNEQLLKSTKNVDNLRKEIETLFQMAGCDSESLKSFLGSGSNNKLYIILYMKILEHQSAFLLKKQDILEQASASFAEHRNFAITLKILENLNKVKRLARVKGMGGPFKPVATIPNSFDSNEDDDEEKRFYLRPLTYQEHKDICTDLLNHAGSYLRAFVQGESEEEDGVSNFTESETQL